MISSSINSNVAQRTKFFGMMRCIGMSKQQIIRFVKLEALNWCKTAVPIGILLGIVVTWGLCAGLRFLVGGEFSDIPLGGSQSNRYYHRNNCGSCYSTHCRQVSGKTSCKGIACNGSIGQFGKHKKCNSFSECQFFKN